MDPLRCPLAASDRRYPRRSAFAWRPGGQSWLQVERRGGGIVYDAILESGQNKSLPLGSGLKIRSGRPDLLYVAVGMLPDVRLGAVNDLDWFEFRP